MIARALVETQLPPDEYGQRFYQITLPNGTVVKTLQPGYLPQRYQPEADEQVARMLSDEALEAIWVAYRSRIGAESAAGTIDRILSTRSADGERG